MEVEKTSIDGVLLLKPKVFGAQNLGPVGCITNRFLIS